MSVTVCDAESLPAECSADSDAEVDLLREGRVVESVAEALSSTVWDAVGVTAQLADSLRDGGAVADTVSDGVKERVPVSQHWFAAVLVHATAVAELARLPKLAWVIGVSVSKWLQPK